MLHPLQEAAQRGVPGDRVRFQRGRWLGLKNEKLLFGNLIERLGVDGEIFRQHVAINVRKQVGDRKGAVLGKLAIRKSQQKLAAVASGRSANLIEMWHSLGTW
jgi:hypothetical protein